MKLGWHEHRFILSNTTWLLENDDSLCCIYVSGRGGTAGNKFRMSLGLPVAAVVNCADNTG